MSTRHSEKPVRGMIREAGKKKTLSDLTVHQKGNKFVAKLRSYTVLYLKNERIIVQ